MPPGVERDYLEELAEVHPRFFWAAKEGAPVQTGLERWFSTQAFRAQQLAPSFPHFAQLIDGHGVLKDLSYTVTVLRGGLEANNNHLAVHLSHTQRLLAFLHGWAGRWEVWGHFPHLVMLFARTDLAVFNLDMPGMGRSGYQPYVNGRAHTLEGIQETLMQAYKAVGIEPPADHQKLIHIMHSMGPEFALAYWQPLLKDPQHGFIFAAPFLPELSRLHRVLACDVLGGSMRLLYPPIAGPLIGRIAARSVTRIWGGPHTQDYVGQAHHQTVQETDPRLLARSMSAARYEWPMAQLQATQGLKDTNVLWVTANNDLFTPGNLANEAALAAGLGEESIYPMPEAGHYLFSIPLLTPPTDLPPTREALADWVIGQAAQEPGSHFANVVSLAQRAAQFVDEL